MFCNIQLLRSVAAEYGIDLTPSQLDVFEKYAAELVEWNQKMNLTAITDPDGIAVKHFLDSLLILKAGSLPQNAVMADVGSGAGFPMLPLAIARPDIQGVMIDGLQKRVNFLNTLCENFSFSCRAVHMRAEEAGKKEGFRESFAVVTARAVAAANVLCEYCLPLVQPGGLFLMMKGGNCAGEIEQAGEAIKILGGAIRKICPFNLPGGDARSIVVIEKISHTPPKYPRNSGKITKKPL